jgi:signal transduction histidine kinase
MRKIVYASILLLGWLFLANCAFGQDRWIDSDSFVLDRVMLGYNLDTLFLQKDIYQFNSKPYAALYMDQSRHTDLSQAINRLKNKEFKTSSNIEIPGIFSRGIYDYWSFFFLSNAYDDSLKVLIHGPISQDSIWIFDSKKLLVADFIFDTPQLGQEDIISMPLVDAHLLKLPPNTTYGILMKQYDIAPPSGGLFPLLSDANTYEKHYFKQYHGLMFIYILGFSFLLAVLCIFGVQLFYNRDKIFLYYCLYLLINMLIIWRNFEGINTYFISTKLYFSWEDTKIFHTAFFFIFYLLFIYEFLDRQPRLLKNLTLFIVSLSILVMLVEIPLMNLCPHCSWLVYFWYRFIVTLLGILSIIAIWNSTNHLSKYILIGSLAIIFSEITSWFFVSMQASYTISLLGVLLEVIIFATAMGLRAHYMARAHLRLKIKALEVERDKEAKISALKSQIAQDIHDEVGSELSKISLAAHVLSDNDDIVHPGVKDQLNYLSLETIRVHSHLRDLVFSINPTYDTFELIQAYFREFTSSYWDNTPMLIVFDFPPSELNPIVDGSVRSQLIFILKEANQNILKHAKASQIKVTFVLQEMDQFLFIIEDNGQGFSLYEQKIMSNGLKNMKIRCDRIKSEITIYSDRDQGTKISITGPIN